MENEITVFFFNYWKGNFPMTLPVRLLVGLSVMISWKGGKWHFHALIRALFFSWEQRIHKNENTYNFFYQTVLSTISRLLSDFVTNSPKALGVETLTNETWRREGIRLKTRISTRSLIIMINWNSNGEFMSELKKKG